MHKKAIAFLPALLLVAGFVGCEAKGPAQDAGSKVDRAAEKVHDAVIPTGPVEKAGRAVDKTLKN